MMTETEDTLSDVIFHVRRSVRYHVHRQRFFERWARLSSWLTVVSGSVIFASLMGDNKGAIQYIIASLIVTAVQAAELFYTPAEMARKHSELRKRFIELEAMLVGISDDDCSKLVEAKQQRLRIEADEPPVMHLLDNICHNEMLMALGYKPDRDSAAFAPVPSWKRPFAHFLSFDPHA